MSITSSCEDIDYGIMGQSSSIFYNLYSALSVTGKGQSIISTAMTTFERFMGQTMKFRSIDECLMFVERILAEPENEIAFEIRNVTKQEVIDKLFNESLEQKKLNYQIITKFINNSEISQHKLNKLYYKNNFYTFLENESILEVFNNIISLNIEFRDPNEIPEDIEGTMDDLWKAFEEFVLYDYITYNKIETLKYNPREVVLGVKC